MARAAKSWAGALVAGTAFLVSLFFVRDTASHVALEQATHHSGADARAPRMREAFPQATYRDPALRSCSQAGLVNNLNDALAWGLVPLYLTANGAGTGSIGLVAGIYPAVWGLGQIWTGHRSDRVGRKPLIVAGMLVQAAALALLITSNGAVTLAAISAVGLGAGTALVYPTLIATISDRASPVARPPMVGVYRFWRDTGFALGAIVAGLGSDLLSPAAAIVIVAALTAASGLAVLATPWTRRPPATAPLPERP